MYFSISAWWIGDASRPIAATADSSSALYATPPPAPPSVNAGRTMTG